MFAHLFSLLIMALNIATNREKMGGRSDVSLLGSMENSEVSENYRRVWGKQFQKMWRFFFVRKVKPAVFPLPGIEILEDLLTCRSPTDVSIPRPGV